MTIGSLLNITTGSNVSFMKLIVEEFSDGSVLFLSFSVSIWIISKIKIEIETFNN
jgi:hypothetical protein